MVRPRDRDAWLALVALRRGIVTRGDCYDHGVTLDAVRRELAGQRWQRLHDTVFATSPGPLDHAQRVAAAILEVGGFAAASHESAVWLASPTSRPPHVPHLAVLENRRVRHREGMVLHWLPDLGDERVLWTAQPPRVRLPIAVLDLVHAATDDDERARILAEVVSRGAVSIAQLRETLAARPRMRARALVEDMLADVAEGAHSPLEVRDLRNDRRHGLVGARRQVLVRRANGVDRVDVVFAGQGLRRRVIKELDGRLGHADLEGRWRDMTRDNVAETRGDSHLRYGWRDLAGRPCEVAAQVFLVLRRAGWVGSLRRCGPGCRAMPPS